MNSTSHRADGRADETRALVEPDSESMREPMPELKPRYDGLSDASRLFTNPGRTGLRMEIEK